MSKLTEAETKEIEKEARKFASTILGIEVNDILSDDSVITGYIAGATRMAEKKNLEVKIWKNTADEFKKYNDDLKAQLEAAQEAIKIKDKAIEILKDVSDKVIESKEAELSRVKEELEEAKEIIKHKSRAYDDLVNRL